MPSPYDRHKATPLDVDPKNERVLLKIGRVYIKGCRERRKLSLHSYVDDVSISNVYPWTFMPLDNADL
jgi:hypothetical protein